MSYFSEDKILIVGRHPNENNCKIFYIKEKVSKLFLKSNYKHDSSGVRKSPVKSKIYLIGGNDNSTAFEYFETKKMNMENEYYGREGCEERCWE